MSDLLSQTEEQRIAVGEHTANLVVVAGAGSGKTHVLVERYLSLLEHNDWPVESLVAITFTEKAAREMRDRVRRRVEEKTEEATKSGDEVMARRWSNYRSTMDRALISTIHSLCATLLRRFAAEASIDPHFEVLEEIDATLLQEKALSETLADLDVAGGDEMKLYSHYEAQTIVDTLKSLLAKGSAASDQMKKLPDSAEELLDIWQHYQQAQRQMALEELWQDDEWCDAVARILNNKASNPDDKLEAIRAAAATRIPAARGSDLTEACHALRDIAETIKLNVGAQGPWGGKDGLQEAKGALRALRDQAKLAVEAMGPDFGEIDELAAKALLLWRGLYQHTLDRYQMHKDQRSAVDFDDLEQRTRALLVEHPHVAEQCRMEIRHLLVDEFQDTSPVQRDIVYQLAPPEVAGRLFVVGDPKQSIYRFRGADITLFRQVQDELKRRGGREVQLSESFRTHDQLVRTFNVMFGAVLGTASPHLGPYEVALDKDMSARRPTRPDQGPVVEFLLVPQSVPNSDGNDDGSSADGTIKINAFDSRRIQAFEIASRLKEMVDNGREVWDKESKSYRPMRYDDVAILFRASTGFLVFEEAFRTVGLRYVTLAGKSYFKRQEVWNLVNLLKVLDNPFDDLSLASVLRSPMFGFSDEALFALRQIADPLNEGHTLPLYLALDVPEGVPERDLETVAFASEVFKKLRALVGRASLLEVLQSALRETGYLATVSALSNGARRRGNVEKLLALARVAPSDSITDFTARLGKLRDQEARESEALVDTKDAVQLMTVHAAKGLEFPVVVIADASSAGNPKSPGGPLLPHPTLGYVCRLQDEDTGKLGNTASWEWGKRAEADADRAEEKRVLYVAATRAQDYLIVAGKPAQSKSDGGSRQSATWLDRCLDALGCGAVPTSDGGDSRDEILTRDWGTIKVRWLQSLPPDQAPPTALEKETDGIAAQEVIDDGAFSFAMPLREDPLAVLEDFTATGFVEIGVEMEPSPEALANSIRTSNRRAWTIARERVEPYIPGRVVGDIAHRALEQWRLPSRTPKLKEVLRALAWNRGLTDQQAVDKAAEQAYELLRRFERSGLCKEMTEAEATRRHEVPFAFKRNGRMVHGSIDAIFQRPGRRWVMVDFKTDFVDGGRKTLENDPDIRHLIQVGIYATALAEFVGETPVVLLHYIRYGQTVPVIESTWRQQIEKLGWN